MMRKEPEATTEREAEPLIDFTQRHLADKMSVVPCLFRAVPDEDPTPEAEEAGD